MKIKKKANRLKLKKCVDELKKKPQLDGYEIKNESRLFPEKNTSSKADIRVAKKGGWKTFVEIEKTQTHPEGNVLKYWFYLTSKEGKEAKIRLIHLFLSEDSGGDYSGDNYKSRRDLCTFLNEKIKEDKDCKGRFEYFPEHDVDEKEIVHKILKKVK